MTNAWEELSDGILERHGELTLAVDIMYINEIPFIMWTSRDIHFWMAKLIKNIKVSTIKIAIKQVIEAYPARGFKYDTS